VIQNYKEIELSTNYKIPSNIKAILIQLEHKITSLLKLSSSSVPTSSSSTQSSSLISFLNPHIIELTDTGFINSHIDSIKFSGNLIAGLSIGSTRVMTLKYDESSHNSNVNSYRSSCSRRSGDNSINTKQEENIYHIGNKNVDADSSSSNNSNSSIIMNDDLKISSILNKISDDKVKENMTSMIHSSLHKLIDHDYIINDHGLLFTTSNCNYDNNSSSNNNNDNMVNHHHDDINDNINDNNCKNISTTSTSSIEEHDSSIITIKRPIQVDLTLSPRSLYILTGCWRYHYSHAILPSLSKRTSIIFRDIKQS
jgi:hypothetical protein